MNYRFQSKKATEAAAAFLNISGGELNIMKLVKLMYLLDRESISKRRVPVCGGRYLSMRDGPVISELLDLINSKNLRHYDDVEWDEFIGDRINHKVRLNKSPGRKHLSDDELSLIKSIWKQFGDMDQWEIAKYCHKNCAEWTPVEESTDNIGIKEIASALGRPQSEIKRLKSEARSYNKLDAIFNPRCA